MIISGKLSRDKSRDHTKSHCYSKMLGTVKSDPCAKFRLNVIIVATNIASKHFSLKKAPGPGLKHLEMQLNFGDTGGAVEQAYNTLGKLKCYGMA